MSLSHLSSRKFRIIAVGNQSSGKSSVLQSLIGKEILPRGDDIVTRCPQFIRVHQTEDKEENQDYVVFPKEEQYGHDEVTETDMSKVMAEIEKRTLARVNGTKNVSQEEIQVDFYSSRFPDLQFVDLPGFTKTAVEGQNKDIEQQVLDLVLKYMENEENIILAIQDSTQDIASSEALKFAEKYDPNGERTIGVLTKLDRLDHGTDTTRVINYLLNKTKPLKLGYFGVVNRSQKQIDEGLEMKVTLVAEERIRDGTDYRVVKNRIGVDFLRKFLTHILARTIKDKLPYIKNKSKAALESVCAQLEELDDNHLQDKNKRDAIICLAEEVITDLEEQLGGFQTGVSCEKLCLGAELNQKIKRETITKAESSRQFYSHNDFHEMLSTALANMYAVRDPLMPVQLVLDKGVGMLTEAYRNNFECLLKDVTELLSDGVERVTKSKLEQYPYFFNMVKSMLHEEINNSKDKIKHHLDIMIDINRRVVNTEHPSFDVIGSLKKKRIRYPNKNEIWFKEQISIADDFQQVGSDLGDGEDGEQIRNIVDTVGDIVENVVPGGSMIKSVLKPTFHGFTKDLQNQDKKNKISTARYPSKIPDEANVHVDLCVQYMKILDEILVDQVPKLFITMLVHRTLDYLHGSSSLDKSLLREITQKLSSEQEAEKLLLKSREHSDRIAKLKGLKTYYEETIRVVDDTYNNLLEF
ncbi:dynamin-1 isoform X2 [Eurytemora carolleeae]|uniref:dynamin-1 isoform X2 n=1 Tax=Eurytemora carolleeae TaxID=1294199 RepID=UPI000C78A56F|nr:dynamin-1 isoform X2 [Eurytemora carolleeae]|eukprot:XP_023331482.1 dynamin-1-like isoform X2 [Eurytemora affinis]